MQVSRLLQRLHAPGGHSHFGGSPGWRGGFTDEGLALVNDNCFSFDYMGAAEYEGGIVPTSLGKIIRNIGKYETIHVEGYGSQDDIKWRPREEPWDVGPLPPLFVFAPKQKQDYVIELVTTMWSDPYYFKDNPGLQTFVKYPDNNRLVGWLDLDQDILLFLDWKVCTDAIEFLKKQKPNIGKNWLVT
jgi:hypothetical protein